MPHAGFVGLMVGCRNNKPAAVRRADGPIGGGRLPSGGARRKILPRHHGAEDAAMTDEQIHAAAMVDPDVRPMTDEEFARAKKVPRIETIRRALKLTLEEFADRYRIPLTVAQDWERGITEPDAVSTAYLRAIAGNSTAVLDALRAGPKAD